MKYFKHIIIFSSRLYNSNIANLFIFKVSINKFTRNSFRPLTPLLDQSCRIYAFGFELCNRFVGTKSNVQYNIL